MDKSTNLKGQRFGSWTVLRPSKKKRLGGHKYWVCQCDCGRKKEVYDWGLRSGSTSSCGKCPRENSSSSTMITYKGETLTLAQWCRKLNLDYRKTYYRINTLGWNIEDAFTRPANYKENGITYKGETLSLTEWCRRLNLNYHTINRRIENGWNFKDAISTPPLRKRK